MNTLAGVGHTKTLFKPKRKQTKNKQTKQKTKQKLGVTAQEAEIQLAPFPNAEKVEEKEEARPETTLTSSS